MSTIRTLAAMSLLLAEEEKLGMNKQKPETIQCQREIGVDNPTLPSVIPKPKAQSLDTLDIQIGHANGQVILQIKQPDGTVLPLAFNPSSARRLAELIRQTSHKAQKVKRNDKRK